MDLLRQQLVDEYRERVKRTVIKHSNSRGIPSQGITAYAAAMDTDQLRSLVSILHGQFEQLAQDILAQK